jgi:alanine-synthesizing transaminase
VPIEKLNVTVPRFGSASAAPSVCFDSPSSVIAFSRSAANAQVLDREPRFSAKISALMFAERTSWNLVPNRLTVALERYRASGRPLIDLTCSNPTACGLSCDSEHILGALANPSSLGYEPDPKGLLTSRRAVADYYTSHGAAVDPASIVITTATSEAYAFAFRTLCDPCDEVLIPEPSYPLFEFLAEVQDVRLVRYPLLYDHGWQIDFHTLESAITEKTRAVIVVHPNNPTGNYAKGYERSRLNEICAPREMAILADEVFLDFSLNDTAQHARTFALNTAALTFTMSGISKVSGLPQMKAAWLIASGPDDLRSQALERLEVISDTYLSVSAPIQHALPKFLAYRTKFQHELLARVRANLAELDLQLATQKLSSRLEVEGGWYAILRTPATRTDEETAINLLETQGVSIHPGHFYDFPGDGYLVVSLITPESDFKVGIRLLLASF